MHKLIVFVWETYYPEGGSNDIKGICNYLDEAKEKIKTIYIEKIITTATIQYLMLIPPVLY